MISLPLVFLLPLVCSEQKKTVIVGVAAVEEVLPSFIGFSRSGGAIGIAMDRLRLEGLIDGVDFKFLVNYTECDADKAVAVAVEFMKKQDVDVVIAPPCPTPARMMGHLSTFYKKAVLGWGFLTDYEFSNTEIFPYITKITPDSFALMKCVLQLFATFNWDRVAIFYTSNEVKYCDSVVDDTLKVFKEKSSYYVNVVQKTLWHREDDVYFTDQVHHAKNSVRIILLCLDTAKDLRDFMKKASELDMMSEEFVYISLGTLGLGFGQTAGGSNERDVSQSNGRLSNGLTPFWVDIENNYAVDNVAKEAATRMLTVDINSDDVSAATLEDFAKKVVPRVRGDPLYCSTPACLSNDGKKVATWARHLHDVFYLYGLSLNDSLAADPLGGQANASYISDFVMRSFIGLTGSVTVNENGTRDPFYAVFGVDKNYEQVAYINFTINNGTPVMSKGYEDEATSLWSTRSGKRPLSIPICGYTGTECPKSFWDEYVIYFAVGGALAGIFFFAAVAFVIYVIRMRKQEEEQQRLLWQIPYSRLRKPSSMLAMQQKSKRSLQSGPSVMTGDSDFSSENNFEPYEVYFLDKDPVLTMKYPVTKLTRENCVNFSRLRKLQQDNLHRFLGLSSDSAEFVTIWRMCSRGTLLKLISKGSLWFDPFFMHCIMRDIAQGLRFLHNSFIEFHGRLSSECCLVNESWQVMLSDYGTQSFQEETHRKKKRFLWTAPEHLRGSTENCSKEGDIFSFAIISSEVITRKPPWNFRERKENLDELLYMIKRGGQQPIRPDLSTEGEINSSLLHLIRDCWSDRPTERPTAGTICKILETNNLGKKGNLMDHMFNMLEEYTTTLELDVEERTKELQEEKKKADLLLRKMLPRQVADRLKLGQTVESESFDSVTVFFSDVVKFTQLAAKCTAYQTVNLLNDLYNGFDAIIEEHCVYKVESIGDGYLCVSGLPVRNGHSHVKEIAELSLSFMEFVNQFRITSLPRERIQLRIGVNTGSCVAGVVGSSMPRYCLFGDTVNTASRMESNGKAGHIHLSKESRDLLDSYYHNEYEIRSRGEVIIKGKGVMETFWLLGRHGPSKTPHVGQRERAQQPTEPTESTELAVESEPTHIQDESNSNTVINNQSESMYKTYLLDTTLEVL